MRILAATAILALMTSPALAQDAAAPAEASETVEVTMTGADGTDHGTATLTQTPNGLLVSNDFTGLPDGEHAIHFHQVGVCEGDFTSAGEHHNPTTADHGHMVEGGPHAGDLPNFTAVNGQAVLDHVSPLTSLTGEDAPLNDDDGSTIIIHANADDYMSQPSGDSGGRIACGVVYAAQ